MTTETKPKPRVRTVSSRDKIRVVKPRLDVFWSENDRFFFIRMNEDDKNDDSLVTLYRLLEANNIDTERGMKGYGRFRAMKVPAYVYKKLKHYYEVRELTLTQWLTEL